MTLTVGPKSSYEDEKVIGAGYQQWLALFLFPAPAIALGYFDTKMTAGFCIGAALVMLHEIGGRLHDLCIRTRRTNILLREIAIKLER